MIVPLAAEADEGDHLPVITDDELLAASLADAEVIELEDRAPAEAASSVHFTTEELRQRPMQSPSDVLRQVPGLSVVQHAGGGKADQYFLRGFDADHGTDVALFVDGIPVNLTSHGHGQGYADARWIIPETIATVDVHKGPYAARYGDFYTAGAIEMRTIDDLDRPTVWLTGGTELAGPVAGQRLSSRLVGMSTPEIGGGKALIAAELGETDGPFIAKQNFKRGALYSKWQRPLGPGRLKTMASFYAASWNQSGQIPAGEVAAGRLDRFGAIDPTEGGNSTRASASVGYIVERGRARWRVDAYAVRYDLQLFSNFTLFARDTLNGDQIEQTDNRMMYGTSAVYQRSFGDSGPVQALVTTGVQGRMDDVDTSLWHTASRERLTDCFANRNPCNRTANMVVNAAAYAEADIALHDKLHFLPGLRVDQFAWRVDDLDPETMHGPMTTGGRSARGIVSPKFSTVYHASKGLNLFANAGRGFHSNDARAAVASRGAGSLAAAWGGEVGARVAPTRQLRASFAVWYLYLASEQVWSGDFGTTEPSDPSRRRGIDADIAWSPTPWLMLDANVAVARTTVVLAPRLMGGGGVSVTRGKSRASLRARGIDRRAANDDGSLIADGSFLVDLVAAHRVGRAEVTLTVNNLFDSVWREAQFAETSRATMMGELREDIHFTPGMPLTALVTLAMSY
jgi:outer membrane receptor protein involved in Fe transport